MAKKVAKKSNGRKFFRSLVELSGTGETDSWQAFADELVRELPLTAVQVESWEPWQVLAQSGIPAGRARDIPLKGLTRTVGAVRVWHDNGTLAPAEEQELESVCRLAAVILDRSQEFHTNHEVLTGTLHDLRSPSRRVGLYAQMRMEDKSNGDHDVEMQQFLHLDLAMMERLFTLLKEWINASAGSKDGGEIRPALERVLSAKADEIAERNVHIETSKLQNFVVSCPEGMLARIFAYLLENALAYCPEPIVIDISSEAAGIFARIEVQDNGPGIPVEESEQAFRPYHRLVGTPPGHGMGLALVRRLAMSHGGWARRIDSQRGLAIEIGLPIYSR